MIKSIQLPEATALTELSVDLMRSKVLPGFALFEHGCLDRKRGQNVDAVWHYNKIRQLVSVAIKLVKTVAHNFRDRPISQHAGPVTGIEFVVPAFGEMLIEFCLSFNVE